MPDDSLEILKHLSKLPAEFQEDGVYLHIEIDRLGIVFRLSKPCKDPALGSVRYNAMVAFVELENVREPATDLIDYKLRHAVDTLEDHYSTLVREEDG